MTKNADVRRVGTWIFHKGEEERQVCCVPYQIQFAIYTCTRDIIIGAFVITEIDKRENPRRWKDQIHYKKSEHK